MLPGTAVAVAERYADGLARDEDLEFERRGAPFPNEYAEWVVGLSAFNGARQAVDWLTSARDLMKIDPDALRHVPIPLDATVNRSVLLLRDIFGNPFRPSPTLDSSWRTAAVLSVAHGMYESRSFDHMPALADALEAVGCTELDILEHCRSGGEHVRGCWVVDLVLGRE
jgi:hypothetical protein